MSYSYEMQKRLRKKETKGEFNKQKMTKLNFKLSAMKMISQNYN